MSELKPCPFCGGSASIAETSSQWMVECNNADCGSNPDVLRPFKYQAIEAWNSRAQPVEAQTMDADKIDAERYRHLRELMQFSMPPNKPTTMKLRASLPAPEHNPHRDWIGEQFDMSVDRTVDASLRACLTSEEIKAFDAIRTQKESADQSREAGK